MSSTKGRILWIDDEIELLRPHIILLTQRGYIVESATNGEDAIEMVRANHYGLIFLDENMVGLSGLDTLPLLKDIDPAVPIVMVTKNEAESVMEDAIGNKIDDYLTKPVNPTQILAACKKYLESSAIEQNKFARDYMSSFAELSSMMGSNLGWREWMDIYIKLVNWSLELDRYPQLGFSDTLADQWRQANGGFSKFVEENYIYWINNPKDEDTPPLSTDVFGKWVAPHMGKKQAGIFLCYRLYAA